MRIRIFSAEMGVFTIDEGEQNPVELDLCKNCASHFAKCELVEVARKARDGSSIV